MIYLCLRNLFAKQTKLHKHVHIAEENRHMMDVVNSGARSNVFSPRCNYI